MQLKSIDVIITIESIFLNRDLLSWYRRKKAIQAKRIPQDVTRFIGCKIRIGLRKNSMENSVPVNCINARPRANRTKYLALRFNEF